MRKNKKKIVIFDVCGTLTKTNNTYSFVLFVCKHNKFNYVRYFINVFLIDVFSLLGVGNFYDKRRVIKLLKGYSKDQLKKYSLEYAKLLYKKNLVNENLLGQLKKYKKLGYRVILLSASFDISIYGLAKSLGVNLRASKLGFVNGYCTGEMVDDLTGNKLSFIDGLIKDNNKSSNIIFYSDNYEDIDVFLRLKKCYAVVHNKADEKYWQKYVKKSNVVSYPLETSDGLSGSLVKKGKKDIYIPGMYYVLSRPFSLFSIAIKEILPLSFFIYQYFSDGHVTRFVSLLIIYFVFYCYYEIGIVYNDYIAVKNEKNPSLRIPSDMKIYMAPFVLIRLAMSVTIALFYFRNYEILLMSALVTVVLIFHSVIKKENRVITFIILRILKAFVPSFLIFGERFMVPLLFLFVGQHFLSILLYCGKLLKMSSIILFKYYGLIILGIFLFLVISGNIVFTPLLILLFLLNYCLSVQYRFFV